jgi:hypothetical protein
MGDFLVRRRFCEGFGVVLVSVSPSGSGVDSGLRSGSETEAPRGVFFLGVLFPVVWRWGRRSLLEGDSVELDSCSTADERRFFDGVDREGGSGGVRKRWVTSSSVVSRGSNVYRWDSVGG